MIRLTREEIERLYRMVADDAPREEVLQLIHDLAGVACNLRPPVQEINLARLCGTEHSRNG